jgi:hypothetical protein
MGHSAFKISGIENARTEPCASEIKKLLALYGAEDRSVELLELVQEGGPTEAGGRPTCRPPAIVALIVPGLCRRPTTRAK